MDLLQLLLLYVITEIVPKEYATIDAKMAYLNLVPFRIKVDRIFNGLKFTLYGENTCV